MPIAPRQAVYVVGTAILLAGCSITGDRLAGGTPSESRALAMAPPADVTGSIENAKTAKQAVQAADKPKATEAKAAPLLPGDEPEATEGGNGSGVLAEGRAAYRANHFREAERLFRQATQLNPRSSEGWIGLAASSDRLRDFAQADWAYGKAREVAGPTAEVLNNQGYSYILRGDLKRARETLTAARKLDPDNKYVENNLALLASNESKARR